MTKKGSPPGGILAATAEYRYSVGDYGDIYTPDSVESQAADLVARLRETDCLFFDLHPRAAACIREYRPLEFWPCESGTCLVLVRLTEQGPLKWPLRPAWAGEVTQ